MDATISPARVRAAGLSQYLRLVLSQTMHVAIVGFVPFGLSTVVTASDSGAVSYSELCSLLAWSMMLTGFLFALVIGTRSSRDFHRANTITSARSSISALTNTSA